MLHYSYSYSTPQPSPPMSPLVAPATPRTPGAPASDASPLPTITLTAPPSNKRRRRGGAARSSLRAIRAVRALFRSLPILAPACRFPGVIPRHGGGGGGPRGHGGHIGGACRTTGTLFGHRRARVTLAVQETPGSVPVLLLELAMQTGRFMQEMGAEHLRVALECEKKPPPGAGAGRTRLLHEPLWTAYVNGRKIGYAVRREPTEDDLTVLQLLRTVSAGAGVLPADAVGAPEGQDAGDLAYMRAHFDRVVGSRDSESFYMLNPDGNHGPELSIFFIRI